MHTTRFLELVCGHLNVRGVRVESSCAAIAKVWVSAVEAVEAVEGRAS